MILTVAAAQVAVMLVALSPVFFEQDGWRGVALALVPALTLTGLGTWLVTRAWKGFRIAAGTLEGGSPS
jgi:hypothetical protein